jgi:hypothetical protein
VRRGALGAGLGRARYWARRSVPCGWLADPAGGLGAVSGREASIGYDRASSISATAGIALFPGDSRGANSGDPLGGTDRACQVTSVWDHLSVAWVDQGRPWLVMTLEDVAHNVDVSRYIKGAGP